MEQPIRIRKKPKEIEAIRWTGDNTQAVKDFVGPREGGTGEEGFLTKEEVFGEMKGDAIVYDKFHWWVNVFLNQWVLRGVEGEFYPCDHNTLLVTYDFVHDADERYAWESYEDEQEQA